MIRGFIEWYIEYCRQFIYSVAIRFVLNCQEFPLSWVRNTIKLFSVPLYHVQAEKKHVSY